MYKILLIIMISVASPDEIAVKKIEYNQNIMKYDQNFGNSFKNSEVSEPVGSAWNAKDNASEIRGDQVVQLNPLALNQGMSTLLCHNVAILYDYSYIQ